MSTATQGVAASPRPMLHALAKSWWLVLLRGIAGILFGLLAFAWPGLTLVTLVLLYGAYAVVDGAFALAAAFTGAAKPAPTWWLIIVGLLGIAAGAVTIILARRHGAGADLADRRMGDCAWHLRNHRRDSIAQGNRQRMVVDLGRGPVRNLWPDGTGRSGSGRACVGLGHRCVLNRVRRDARRVVNAAAEASAHGKRPRS